MNKKTRTRIIIIFSLVLLCLYLGFAILININKHFIYTGIYNDYQGEIKATLDLKIKWNKLKFLNSTDFEFTITDENGKVLESTLDPVEGSVLILKDHNEDEIGYYRISGYMFKRSEFEPIQLDLNKTGFKIMISFDSKNVQSSFSFVSE